MDTNLFKVGVTVAGKYVHGTEYDMLTQVYYDPEDGGDGCSYISRTPNKNIIPGTNPKVWVLCSKGGDKGDEGKSAYQVAVDNGYVGTEQQWLASLVGPKGDKGDTGTKGEKGEQGNTGSSVEFPFELVNNRTTDDPEAGLTAAEGKRIGDDITAINRKFLYSYAPTSVQYYKAINYIDGELVTPGSKNIMVATYTVSGNFIYSIDGRVPTTEGSCLYAFYDVNGNYLSDSSVPTETGGYQGLVVTSPASAVTLKICGNANPASLPYNPSLSSAVKIDNLVNTYEILGGWVMERCMKTNQGVGEVCTKTAEVWASHRYVIVPVDPSLRYVINGESTVQYRLWAFLNASDVILSVADASASASNNTLVLTPPEGATQLILNTSYNDAASYIFHPSVDQSMSERVDALESSVDVKISLAKSEVELKETKDHNNDIFDSTRSYAMTFTAGKNHSSGSDQMKINIPAGASFGAMFISGTASFRSTRSLYAFYADGTNETLRAMTRGTHYFFVAKKDIVAFGNYSAGSDITESGTMYIVVWNNDSRSGGQYITAFNEDVVVKQYLTQMTKKRKDCPKSIVTLVHFSDLHGDSTNLERIVSFYNRYADYIDDVVSTGDQVYDTFSNSFSFWDSAGAGGFLSVVGNHDAWSVVGGPTVASEQECYTRYIAPFVESWNVVYVDNKCYYYKDYNSDGSYPVRLIVLDCMHLDSSQESWLADVLSVARTNNYTVIIAVHYTPSPMRDSTVDNSSTFTCYEASSNSTSWATVVNAESIVQDFIDRGGRFACWLCGHYHTDIIGRSLNGQLFISVERANTTLSGTYDARVEGTKTRDSFNVFSIDAAAGYIRLYRIGNDVDRTLRPKVSLCYDYINHKGIYNCSDA